MASTAPRALLMSLGPADLQSDRFLSRARAVCITKGVLGAGDPGPVRTERSGAWGKSALGLE